jgi:hypothetical protein
MGSVKIRFDEWVPSSTSSLGIRRIATKHEDDLGIGYIYSLQWPRPFRPCRRVAIPSSAVSNRWTVLTWQQENSLKCLCVDRSCKLLSAKAGCQTPQAQPYWPTSRPCNPPPCKPNTSPTNSKQRRPDSNFVRKMGSTATPLPPMRGKLIVLTEQRNPAGDIADYTVSNNPGLPIIVAAPVPETSMPQILQAPTGLLKFLTGFLTGPAWSGW